MLFRSVRVGVDEAWESVGGEDGVSGGVAFGEEDGERVDGEFLAHRSGGEDGSEHARVLLCGVGRGRCEGVEEGGAEVEEDAELRAVDEALGAVEREPESVLLRESLELAAEEAL